MEHRQVSFHGTLELVVAQYAWFVADVSETSSPVPWFLRPMVEKIHLAGKGLSHTQVQHRNIQGPPFKKNVSLEGPKAVLQAGQGWKNVLLVLLSAGGGIVRPCHLPVDGKLCLCELQCPSVYCTQSRASR